MTVVRCDQCKAPVVVKLKNVCDDCELADRILNAKWQDEPDELSTVNETDSQLTVAALSPEMLGEEDRRMLRLLRSDAQAYWEHGIPPGAQKQFAWADRLLGSDTKGAE